ncbi:hypothetical protein TNCV_4857861 [Trichonephila clavipes]|nr:hypothetical protein TNCV_4857861 [Trichonephila clavipes]
MKLSTQCPCHRSSLKTAFHIHTEVLDEFFLPLESLPSSSVITCAGGNDNDRRFFSMINLIISIQNSGSSSRTPGHQRVSAVSYEDEM